MPMLTYNARLLPYNDAAVKAAQPIDGSLTEYRIESCPGLVLRVMPSGFAGWWFYYRYRLGARWKLRKMPLGSRQAIALKDAKKAASDLLKETESGADPVATKQARRTAITFKELAERRLDKDNRISSSTREQYRDLLEQRVYRKLGEVPADEVTADMVLSVLSKIEADRQADVIKTVIGSTYRWGMKRRLVRANPCAGLGQRAAAGTRNNVLDTDQLRALWAALESDDIWMSKGMRLIFKLLILTGQRRSEVAGARQAELKLDCDKPTWTIPGDTLVRGKLIEGRTKNGKEQVVPLSKQATALFKQALELASEHEYVFPADPKRGRKDSGSGIHKERRTPHIHGESVTHAMGMLREEKGIEASVHDFRRTIATWMGDQGIRPDVIDLVLNHAPAAQDVTRRHYNFATLEPMVRAALQSWADHVEALVGSS